MKLNTYEVGALRLYREYIKLRELTNLSLISGEFASSLLEKMSVFEIKVETTGNSPVS